MEEICKEFKINEAPNNEKYLEVEARRQVLEDQLKEILRSIKVSPKRLERYEWAIIDKIKALVNYVWDDGADKSKDYETEKFKAFSEFYFLYKRINKRNDGIGLDILQDYGKAYKQSFLEYLMLFMDYYITVKK